MSLNAEFHLDFTIPLLMTAIHNGHEMRDEVLVNCAVTEADRLREEDPHTARFLQQYANRVVIHTSRFEVDLNRPRKASVYLNPQDCWGLTPRLSEPSESYVDRSLAEYDDFYRKMAFLIREFIHKFGRIVIFDVHSYNHHRLGPGQPYDDASLNPEIILGTSNMLDTWKPLVDSMRQKIREADFYGRVLDCRLNVKFTGGYFAQWVHHTFPNEACVVSIEFKKIFMDEWTGLLDEPVQNRLAEILFSTIPLMIA